MFYCHQEMERMRQRCFQRRGTNAGQFIQIEFCMWQINVFIFNVVRWSLPHTHTHVNMKMCYVPFQKSFYCIVRKFSSFFKFIVNVNSENCIFGIIRKLEWFMEAKQRDGERESVLFEEYSNHFHIFVVFHTKISLTQNNFAPRTPNQIIVTRKHLLREWISPFSWFFLRSRLIKSSSKGILTLFTSSNPKFLLIQDKKWVFLCGPTSQKDGNQSQFAHSTFWELKKTKTNLKEFFVSFCIKNWSFVLWYIVFATIKSYQTPYSFKFIPFINESIVHTMNLNWVH